MQSAGFPANMQKLCLPVNASGRCATWKLLPSVARALCGFWLCRYKNDPTIFGWNLINEPRCTKWVFMHNIQPNFKFTSEPVTSTSAMHMAKPSCFK